jgi:hypothetical protein
VIVEEDNKNRNAWKLGIMTDIIQGRDSIIRGARVKTATGTLERAIQQLYPFELSCDDGKFRKPDPTAPTFHPRATRDAAVAVRLRVQDVIMDEEN